MKSPRLFGTRLLNCLLRLLLGAVFVFAGAIKILDPEKFAVDVYNYRMLPYDMINSFAIALPWVEVVAGLLLVLGIWVRASALVISGLTVMFFIAISQAVARGLNIECGCFGTAEGSKVGIKAMAWDGLLMAIAAWLCWRTKD